VGICFTVAVAGENEFTAPRLLTYVSSTRHDRRGRRNGQAEPKGELVVAVRARIWYCNPQFQESHRACVMRVFPEDEAAKP
jgi:hypothetical protein